MTENVTRGWRKISDGEHELVMSSKYHQFDIKIYISRTADEKFMKIDCSAICGEEIEFV
jgi:hypothetical protein